MFKYHLYCRGAGHFSHVQGLVDVHVCHRVTSCQPGAWLHCSDSLSSGTSRKTSPDSGTAERLLLSQLHSPTFYSPAFSLYTSLTLLCWTLRCKIRKAWREKKLQYAHAEDGWKMDQCLCVEMLWFDELWPVNVCHRHRYLLKLYPHLLSRRAQRNMLGTGNRCAFVSMQGVLRGGGLWGKGQGRALLRHDWRGNGLLALPRGVDFTTESHPSTTAVGKEGVGNGRGRARQWHWCTDSIDRIFIDTVVL